MPHRGQRPRVLHDAEHLERKAQDANQRVNFGGAGTTGKLSTCCRERAPKQNNLGGGWEKVSGSRNLSDIALPNPREVARLFNQLINALKEPIEIVQAINLKKG